jgi:hypothetical protein
MIDYSTNNFVGMFGVNILPKIDPRIYNCCYFNCCPHLECPTTFSYKTYAFKYLHLCPALLTKFNCTHFKNLQYSICLIAFIVRSFYSPQVRFSILFCRLLLFILPRAFLFNLIKAFAIKSIESLSGTPPHIS